MPNMVYIVYEGRILDCLPLKVFENLCDTNRWYEAEHAYQINDSDDMEYVCTDWEDWKKILTDITNGGTM